MDVWRLYSCVYVVFYVVWCSVMGGFIRRMMFKWYAVAVEGYGVV